MEFESGHDDGGTLGSTSGGTSELVEFDFDPTRYAEFDVWLDGQLGQLVQRWEHLAAPCAVRRGLFLATRNR